MDENIIDELFNRINTLEQENNILENELSRIKVQQEEKKIEDLVSEENLDENIIIDELNKFADNEINRKLTQSEKKLKKITIEYSPFDNLEQIFIAGDFTKWEQLEMKKVKIYKLIFPERFKIFLV